MLMNPTTAYDPAVPDAADTEKWLNRAEAAQLLGVSVRTVDGYVRDGRLPRYDLRGFTRKPRFRIEDVRALSEIERRDR